MQPKIIPHRLMWEAPNKISKTKNRRLARIQVQGICEMFLLFYLDVMSRYFGSIVCVTQVDHTSFIASSLFWSHDQNKTTWQNFVALGWLADKKQALFRKHFKVFSHVRKYSAPFIGKKWLSYIEFQKDTPLKGTYCDKMGWWDYHFSKAVILLLQVDFKRTRCKEIL